jgi:FKBP-type peptidyl-prolyl cis-trans isomerase (trigger factor)
MPKQYKEIHLKAIKLLKAGMTELKVAETLGKSRGWVQSIKRDPGYQEAFDRAEITPIEPELQELVKDISREIREPSEVALAVANKSEPEPDYRTVHYGMGETRTIDFSERIGILTQAKKIQRLRDELENLAQQNIDICRVVQSILLERAKTLTPEEIPARYLVANIKSIGDTINQALDLKGQALGIEQLQKAYSDQLNITDAELQTVDV